MAIDRKRIIDSLSKIEVAGNQEGLIPAFGVFVNQLPAAFWTSFAERLTRAVGDDLLEAAEYLLVVAAHECGYHTGYGIITSEEAYMKASDKKDFQERLEAEGGTTVDTQPT